MIAVQDAFVMDQVMPRSVATPAPIPAATTVCVGLGSASFLRFLLEISRSIKDASMHIMAIAMRTKPTHEKHRLGRRFTWTLGFARVLLAIDIIASTFP
jgi:hypothetical protein